MDRSFFSFKEYILVDKMAFFINLNVLRNTKNSVSDIGNKINQPSQTLSTFIQSQIQAILNQ